ncbi:ABC transporter ATP-binding protein [Alkalicoccus daliensis]|uniref:ABC-type bacteriocin/lantibiotic exporter, contains an N-terminal double-glycine peptidase domain n=1 Tax=Alkalicoccus daliensis TaxID=745820 RepID=A0A1G9ZMR2_9BACI|nr:ABC transporter ATP-binding protein [Alkalicoccus daliensis]SDN22271.1 ABC-type bacteriocin/lantibiotic exporter, contains an N-terminal double-glycine peptidase domain [Alkalicoccus daliensis]
MKESLKKISSLFNKRERKKFGLIFILMIGAALLETLGVGLMLPFVGIITNPDIINSQPILNYVYELFNFTSFTQFTIFLVIIMMSLFLFKNVYLLAFFYVQYRILLNQQVKLSSQLLKSYLKKPYTFHLQRNSSDLLRNVTAEVPKVFQGMILPAFQLMTEILVITFILTLLVLTAPVATISAIGILGLSIGLFYGIFKKKISRLGTEQQAVTGKMIKWINQSLGASKDVKVTGKENFFIKSFQHYSQIKANNGRYIKMLDQSPRLFIETLLVATVLITMLIVIFQGANTAEIVTTMALFAMAAFRLMPSITRVLSMVTQIKYNYPALEVVFNDLNIDNEEFTEQLQLSSEEQKNKTFKHLLKMDHVSYRYPAQEAHALSNVTAEIPIGSSVAFIGASGSGKTTAMDIMLGLLKPQEGKITIDGQEISKQKKLWQRNIGYIPQVIFLSDDTILRNIAFGIEENEIDEKAAWKALEQAQLKEFVESLPDSIYTNIGERGARISGGQRQRIGIARALYHDPQILFMDEATSALDNNTEKEIMNSLNQLKGAKTLIIIAHRLSTIENCDIIYEMKNGSLINVRKFEKSIV